MEQRRFGATGLQVSLVGFGAWAIGGPAMAGGMPIGWGPADDPTSVRALERALDMGLTFVDTADFYAFGHSETLVGRVVGNRPDVVVATKVGQRLGDDGRVVMDYSRAHVERACEASLARLRRETIDFYQLHTARVPDLERGECLEALERLREAGKIRYWGVSLNTYQPAPEAEFLLARGLGHGVQLVLNVLNQRALPLLPRLHAAGYGIVARMPLQFGLLTGRITRERRFGPDDHRSVRFRPDVLAALLDALEEEVWPLAAEAGLSRPELAMGFCASFEEVSTIIPGIRTPEQAEMNAGAAVRLTPELRARLVAAYGTRLRQVMAAAEQAG